MIESVSSCKGTNFRRAKFHSWAYDGLCDNHDLRVVARFHVKIRRSPHQQSVILGPQIRISELALHRASAWHNCEHRKCLNAPDQASQNAEVRYRELKLFQLLVAIIDTTSFFLPFFLFFPSNSFNSFNFIFPSLSLR